jgi:excisionase family DNA binding protein
VSIKSSYTENEAQALHAYRRSADPEHDRRNCWCCCTSCGFDVSQVLGIPAGEPELLTPAEAAQRLRVTPITLRAWAESGRLPCIRTPGGHRRYNAADISAILNPA